MRIVDRNAQDSYKEYTIPICQMTSRDKVDHQEEGSYCPHKRYVLSDYTAVSDHGSSEYISPITYRHKEKYAGE